MKREDGFVVKGNGLTDASVVTLKITPNHITTTTRLGIKDDVSRKKSRKEMTTDERT